MRRDNSLCELVLLFMLLHISDQVQHLLQLLRLLLDVNSQYREKVLV
jgi:hypothetical protein